MSERDAPQDVAGLPTIVLAVGLVLGLLEVGLTVFKTVVTDRFMWLGPQFIWMTPLSHVGWAALAAVGVWLVRRFVTVPSAWAVGLIALPGLYSAATVFPLHMIAAAILVIGVATQLGRRLTGPVGAPRRPWRRAAIAAGALVLTAGIGLNALQWWRSTAGLRGPPAAPAAPNVLLVILDTVRASSLSVYGNPEPTSPSLEHLAEQGVVFERAFAPSPWTLPSHAAAFTGRLPLDTGASWLTPLDDTYPTLAEALADRGYVTGGFVANLLYCGYEFGLDRGFQRYEDYGVTLAELLLSTSLGRQIGNFHRVRWAFNYYDVIGRKDAASITDAFLDWQGGVPADRPFFAFLNYYDAHEPYLPPPPFDTRFGPSEPQLLAANNHQLRNAILPGRRSMSADEIEAELASYEGAIGYVDQELGRLFARLRERGDFENTLVIVTADHGEGFGEHGVHGHGQTLYPQELWVPLLLAHGDRLPAGLRITSPAGVTDIPATVMSLLDLESPFPGVPLDTHWTRADIAAPDTVVSQFLDTDDSFMVSAVAGRLHLIRDPEGKEALYDVVADIEELHNLVDDPGLQSDRARLSGVLDRHSRR